MHKSEYVRSYRERNAEKERQRHRLKRERLGCAKVRDPAKEKARHAVRNAVQAGKIIKPTECPSCGVAAVLHAHHKDYSKPMVFTWICATCHGKEHRND